MRTLALFLFVCTPAAQQAVPLLPGKFRVPVHTGPADAVHGDYGTWAVGHDYKASFHDGFRCYPRLGRSAPCNLPLSWRTESVLSGTRPLFDRADRRGTTEGDWRHAYRHQSVVEAYDLLAGGVEQSFTVPSVPTVDADLAIVATIETLLVPQAQSWQQAVTFADERGVARLTLGVPRATDARGRPVPVQRDQDRGRLRLWVRAVDLGSVVFPLLFQQLVAPVGLVTGDEFSAVDFARWDGKAYFAVTNRWSATDSDSCGFGLTDSWAIGIFWADASADWSTERVRISTGHHAILRVVGQRTHSSPVRSEVFHYHQAPTAVLNGGAWAWAPTTVGYTQRNPDAEPGAWSGMTITWQEDATSTNADTATTRVCAAPFDDATNSFTAKWIVAEGPTLDAQDAVVEGGLVFWQQRPSDGATPWQIHARGVDDDGPAGPSVHVSAAHADAQCRHARADAIHPVVTLPPVAVTLCSYEFASGIERGVGVVQLSGSEIEFQRELWRSTQTVRLHDVCAAPTWQHWYVLHERAGALRATRLGHSGGAVAEYVVDSGSAACACLGPTWGAAGPLPTPVLFVRTSSPDLLLLATLTFSPLAETSTWGADCGGHLAAGSIAYSTSGAYAGGLLALALTGPPVGTICQLWVAGGQGSSPLTGGCTFLLDASATVVQSFSFSFSWFGHVLQIPLADDPVFLGNLYFQATWPGASLPWVTRASNGVVARVH